jgi:hypothetical protein
MAGNRWNRWWFGRDLTEQGVRTGRGFQMGRFLAGGGFIPRCTVRRRWGCGSHGGDQVVRRQTSINPGWRFVGRLSASSSAAGRAPRRSARPPLFRGHPYRPPRRQGPTGMLRSNAALD